MNSTMTNSALNVKIHGKLKNRINRDMYIRMTNLKSVSALAKFLETETSWGKLLRGIDTEHIHRGFLEQLLSRGIVADIKELSSFTDISTSAFMKLFSIREEIENLKVFLRLLLSGHPERFSEPAVTMGKGQIDFSGLSQIKTFEEFINYIDGTIYAVPLRGFLDYGEKRYIFDIEMSLDIYYREMIFKLSKKYLGEDEQKIIKEAYGSEADLTAIMFILRIKQNFDFPKEQIYFYTRQKYAHLSDDLIKRMADAKNTQEVHEIIKETRYKALFDGGVQFPEKKIEKYLGDLHKKLFRKAGYSVEAVLYYIKMREIELRNIVTITEGIRYSLQPEMIQRYLIGFDS